MTGRLGPPWQVPAGRMSWGSSFLGKRDEKREERREKRRRKRKREGEEEEEEKRVLYGG